MIINFVIFNLKLTGGTRVVMELVNGLINRGHHVNIITFGSPKDLNWIKTKAKIYYANRNLLEKIFGWLYRKIFGFQAWPEEETRKIIKIMPDCDINVATISYSVYAVRRSNKGTAFQYHMHYEPLVSNESYKKKIKEEAYFMPIKKIANSSWVAKTIEKKTGSSIDGLVFPAIDHNIFYQKKEKFVGLDKNKTITIVSLAKYKWWKGLPDALKAIQIVRDKGYNIFFTTFGGEFNKDDLPTEVKKIKFQFVGRKANEELADFYSQADILISSSYFESFPLPQLEAMACGVPVITTPYGTEDYAVDRKNCLIVPPKTPVKLAEAIIELIENRELYQAISKAGPITAKKFNWESSVTQLENIFKKNL